MITAIETDHSALTIDTAMEDTLTSHDNTTDPNVTEAQLLKTCIPLLIQPPQ